MRWLLVLVVLVRVAHADDAADREEARREFTAGQAADRQRDWTTAIEHYLRANDLMPHPNAMYNIANDYERLGKLREAAVWYQRYIDTAQDSPDRDKVIRTLRELQLRPGTITVRSQNPPENVRVLVDGTFAGVTPYSGHIKGGAHRVTLEIDGRREERDVKIEFGEPATLDVTLKAATTKPARLNDTRNTTRTDTRNDTRNDSGTPRETQDAARKVGTLRVSGTPDGATVFVDDRPIGPMPLEVRTKPGLHAVRVQQQGFQPYDTTIEVRENEVAAIEPQLTRALGAVESSTTVRVGYLLGFGAGVDARNDNDGAFLVEGGVRASQYDVSARVGKVIGFTTFDIMFRWAITKTRVAPYLCAGYTFIRGGNTDSSAPPASSIGGYLLSGGLRFDLSRGEHTGISLIADVGVRNVGDLDVSSATGKQSGLIVPVMTSLQITYK